MLAMFPEDGDAATQHGSVDEGLASSSPDGSSSEASDSEEDFCGNLAGGHKGSAKAKSKKGRKAQTQKMKGSGNLAEWLEGMKGPDAGLSALALISSTQADIAKGLKKISRRHHSSGSSSHSSGGRGRFGHPRALRRRIYKRPEEYINRWLRWVREEMRGGTAGNPWSLSLYTEKIKRTFGQNTSLFRSHFLISAAMDEILLRKKLMPGLALILAGLSAMHQAAMDNGRWGTAMTLTPTPDPLGVPLFAGTPDDIDGAATYLDRMASLASKVHAGGKGSGKQKDDEGNPRPEQPPKKPPKGKGKEGKDGKDA